MNILILGNGGREHALTWVIARSERVENIYVAPGNAGTEAIAKNIDISPTDFEAVLNFALQHQIAMIIVGPEKPLVDGIGNFFTERAPQIAVIGPDKSAARLEGSKAFAKDFMVRNAIPTARYFVVTQENLDDGIAYLEHTLAPYVLKADGLASGKGVLILDDFDQAKTALEEMVSGQKFGASGRKVVIEDFVEGRELSCFVVSDGDTYKMLPFAKDYKKIGRGDKGLNTGGMGSVSPPPFVDASLAQKVENSVVVPTLNALKELGTPYRGFLFFGLMINRRNGVPFVIEYNVRLGDPECQSILSRIDTDFLDVLEGVAQGNLVDRELRISQKSAATVVLASEGYPETVRTGFEIDGLFPIESKEAVQIFHAGTRRISGKIYTAGGRILGVTSRGKDHKEALKKSYDEIENIHFQSKYFREDIGFDL